MREKLSVIIPCKNEEGHIADCVRSVSDFADEVIVADSGSTDGTLSIVSRLDCRLIQREYVNSANFKNWAIPQASHEWVFVLDADERVTPELAGEIEGLLTDSPEYDAYNLRRDFTFLGNKLRDCGMTSNRIVRLFRRDLCRYHERRVHADVHVPSEKVGRLENPLLHHMAVDLDHFLARQLRYSSWSALDSWEKGKRISFAKMLIHSPFRFVQLYVTRKGFTNGRAGLVFCGLVTFYTLLKDVKLWALETGALSPALLEESARKNTMTHLLDTKPSDDLFQDSEWILKLPQPKAESGEAVSKREAA